MTVFGGFHAFPGGQLDKEDSSCAVSDSEPGDASAMRACAVREFFEETGVLIARGVERLSPEKIRHKRQSLKEGAKTFKQALEEDGLEIVGAELVNAGRWLTPPFAPRRFDTWFFLAWLPEEQEAVVETSELEEGEWIRLEEAYDRWKRGTVIMAPPTLHIIKTLAEYKDRLDELPHALTAIPEADRGMVRRIEFKPGILLFPVQTPTIPPATHTNCYIVGGNELIVIDPASPYEEEQRELDRFLDGLIDEGRKVREILITHHHPDHTGGVNHLRNRLDVPVAAHQLTAERLDHSIRVDRFIGDNEVIELEGDPGWRVRALHTPGHTRGHLCFFEEKSGAILTGDLVAGIGTIVIDPPEGNMRQYIQSLHRLLALPGLTSLFPSHGPAIGSAHKKLEEYIEHRRWREEKIFAAVEAGRTYSQEIVEAAYTDVSPAMYGLAERSAIAHLEKLEEEGRIRHSSSGYTVA
jgi:glyoxylase-like metal-dependent hydrolase (beta-lactamase superfamily II)/8-oxo-dGTP pyrophosphatase MutT (NUDIX family)